MKKILWMILALISSGSAYARQEVQIGKKVRVTGAIDRDDGYSEINVDRIFILK